MINVVVQYKWTKYNTRIDVHVISSAIDEITKLGDLVHVVDVPVGESLWEVNKTESSTRRSTKSTKEVNGVSGRRWWCEWSWEIQVIRVCVTKRERFEDDTKYGTDLRKDEKWANEVYKTIKYARHGYGVWACREETERRRRKPKKRWCEVIKEGGWKCSERRL